MKLHRYFLVLLMAGAFLISRVAVGGHYDVSRPEIPGPSAMEGMTDEGWSGEFAEPSIPMAEYFEYASVDLCYMGSIVDPATGEIVDLFAHCTDDAIGGNFDLA